MNLGSKILILFFLSGLIFCLLAGVEILFYNQGQIIINDTMLYYVLFFIISTIAFFIGWIWTAIQKSWDLKNFISRVENEETLDYILMLVQRKKDFFKERKKK